MKFGPNGKHFPSLQSFKQWQLEQGLLTQVLKFMRATRDDKREYSILIHHAKGDVEIIVRHVSEATTRGEKGIQLL